MSAYLTYTYYAALQKCGERYREMMSTSHGLAPSRKAYLSLSQFIDSFNYHCKQETASIPKLNRWLGYIQGTLIAWDVTTVNVEREWTRPLFRPLDYPDAPECGLCGGPLPCLTHSQGVATTVASCDHEPDTSWGGMSPMDYLLLHGG